MSKHSEFKTLVIQTETFGAWVDIPGVTGIYRTANCLRVDGFILLENKDKILSLIGFSNPVGVIIKDCNNSIELATRLKLNSVELLHPQGNIGFAWCINFERIASNALIPTSNS